jgi:putative iron-dependent peroxidase
VPPNGPQDRAQEILAPPAKAAIFLTLTIDEGAEADARDALTRVAALTRSVSFRVPEAQLTCVTAIGADVWDRMYGVPRPAQLHRFAPIAGERHTAVSTAGDLFFHLRATRLDLCFELCQQLVRSMRDVARPVDEVHGFRYWDERDLLGFVDGTESPRRTPVASKVALVGDEDPPYTGGSYVVVQKYLHDLATWESLPVSEQERIVGREKLTDIELPDAHQPSNSHVAVTTISDDDGTARQIVRDNMPFGNVAAGEFGTYFIGYAADPGVTERMLHRMFIGEPAGNTDRILEFSTPVTGCLFFAPPADFLASPPAAPPAQPYEPTTPAPDSQPSQTTTSSLGIGSLKRSTS